MESKITGEGLTFDDVLIVPRKSSVHPNRIDVTTRLTRRIDLNIPVVSAAMDTVTEARLAIALAREGGIGFIHRNMSPEEQAEQVDKVKRSEHGMITDPITLPPDTMVSEAQELMGKYRISGVPITESGKLVGILTNRDLRFLSRANIPVREVMTRENLITVPVGTTLKAAEKILHRNRIEKLPVVDRKGKLKGLITIKDIQKRMDFPRSCKDSRGRLRVGAALGPGADLAERGAALVEAHVDVVAVDTAHGHSKDVLEAVAFLKKKHPRLQVVAGNVATAQGTRELIKAGADAVKVGMGPSAICTTRVIAGAGVPQLTAVLDCARAAARARVPIIADGGIKFSGDAAKALAAGAESVMVGSLLAGTEESPGEIILFEGRSFKLYRGMGSIGAMKRGSRDRYAQADVTEESKLVAEGIEGRVPYKGPVSQIVYQLVGGLRSGMGYAGCKNLAEFRSKARFVRQSPAGLRESHPHDVKIVEEAPNYRLS
jgi:IMP dehydrogenase